ncbi:hypothetical protein [Corallococcus sp. RDP092CA]|uniref:hypothetical protein n=1 Tax=Corallococcus sp. RDP092CA TaxID=3109369 RepID=UPI0035AEF715
MQFTLADVCGPPPPSVGFFYALWLSPVVVFLLLRWLRRGPRDAHDVLGWKWFAAMTLLFVLLRLKWLRSPSSKWDVLHIA